jgi:D-apionate oxidoisomerase
MSEVAVSSRELTVAVVGAGGKMGMRVSNNLQRSAHRVFYSENSPVGRQRTIDAGREVTDTAVAVAEADVVILAVPDVALGPVSEQVVPQLRSGAIVLTLDPAAAYANLLYRRGDVEYAVAHPCHPSVFLQRRTEAELNDTFGGIAAAQDVVAALESGNEGARGVAEEVIRLMYAPVIDVHWVTVKQLAYLEPTLVEVVACMIGDLLNEALQETVHTVGVPEAAARAMLFGHVQVALANGLRGDNPFSDACLIAMDYGREKIIKEDWKSIFNDDELDHVLKKMLHLDHIHR